MKCLEVRREILANPHNESASILRHLETCPSCKAFSSELGSQESAFEQALKVPVPARLAEKIILRTSLKNNKKALKFAQLAAVIAIIFIGTIYSINQKENSNWSEIALNHVLNERYTLNLDKEVSIDQIRQKLSGYGLTAEETIGSINYLEPCDMPGGKGLHIVITTEMGKISLIIPPTNYVTNGVATSSVDSSSKFEMAAKVVKIGRIPIAIVTDRVGELGSIEIWLKGKISVV